jgi:hypothetical protein
MMRTVRDRFSAILDQVRTWGLVLPRAGSSRGRVVLVRTQRGEREPLLVGKLWQDQGDFVFEYDKKFVASPTAEPLSPFPQLDETYRSAELWPFFAVRIPPLRRADVRTLLEERGLKPEQTLEILGTLARRSATNPYELALEGEADRDDRGHRTTPAPVVSHSAT